METIVRAFTTKELQDGIIDIEAKLIPMLQHCCPIVYLKELCDYFGCVVNYRQTSKYLWCFFRENKDAQISITTRAKMQKTDIALKFDIKNYLYAYTKRQVSHMMLCNLSNLCEKFRSYTLDSFDIDLLQKKVIYNRELAKRTPLHHVSALCEIARKRHYKIEWKFFKNVDAQRWTCSCIIEEINRIRVVSGEAVFKDDAKLQAAKNMFDWIVKYD